MPAVDVAADDALLAADTASAALREAVAAQRSGEHASAAILLSRIIEPDAPLARLFLARALIRVRSSREKGEAHASSYTRHDA